MREVHDMNNYAETVKQTLLSLIDGMDPADYVCNPKSDFTRNRKLNFATMLRLILSMGTSNLGTEILKYFNFDDEFPSVSAFVQQRQKIKTKAFEYIFREFSSKMNTAENMKLFNGYRLVAVDGSDIVYPLNPLDINACHETKCSIMHLNAFFDIMNKQYVDVVIQSLHESNETDAAVIMLERLPEKFPTIIVADRGYENYNLFAHTEERLFDYVVRLRTSKSSCMFAGMGLPANIEFDITKEVVITRNSTGPYHVNPKKYKYLGKKARFDFVKTSKDPHYPMTIRFVSIKLDNGEYEVLATSLSEDVFSLDMLKELYHLRWGIETSFRELKHVIGMTSFHTKKADCVIQEIYSHLIMYNFSMLIANRIAIPDNDRKYKYLINYSQMIKVCIEFFRLSNNSPPFNLKTILQRFILPERKGRSYTRNVYPQGAKAFNYRLS